MLKPDVLIKSLFTIVISVSILTVVGRAQAAPFAYITNQGANSVSVIDVATNTVTATVTGLGTNPGGIGVSPDGTRVYVANQGSASVSVIDTATNTVTTNVTVGPTPVGVAVTPDGTRVYVANLGSNDVSVISTATNTVTATVAVGTTPAGVADRKSVV